MDKLLILYLSQSKWEYYANEISVGSVPAYYPFDRC